jgi:hypothetical protein
MAGGRDFKKPTSAAQGPAPADADAGKPDPRLMSLRMRSRRDNQAALSKDPEVQKLLQSGNKDPQAYAKAIAASDQPRNALLGDIKDKLGPEFADKVSEALVANELKDDKAADGGGDDKAGGDKGGGGDLASADSFDDAMGDAGKSATGMTGKTGDDGLGAEGYADAAHGKAGLEVSGKSGSLSGDVGVQEDNGKGTVSGTLGYEGDGNQVQGSGSYTDEKDNSATLAAGHDFSDEISGQASLGYTKEEGKPDAITGSLGGKYDGDKFAADAEVDVTKKGDATSAEIKGSGTAKLFDGKLQATVLGSAKVGDLDDDTPRYSLGGSVTLTTSEHSALVASGAMDEKGGLDLSLEFDDFKDKIKGAGDVDDAKKDALVSLYVEYKKGGDNPDEQGVTGGLKMRF